jgi:predicted transcriptional regulator
MVTSIPLKRVVLFKHGLGHFERRGKVKGDDDFKLSFDEKEINDVLKSLSVIDYGGGKISAVDYEAAQETERLLEKVGIQIPVEDSLTSLLKQMMGVKIGLKAGTEELTGRILGVETTKEKENNVEREKRFLVLLQEDAIKTVNLTDIKKLQTLDEDVNKDINYFIDTVYDSRRKNKKTLNLQFRGTGEREVAISYTVEVPVWKTSYRLNYSEENLWIQGWALVDNMSDEDWVDINLTLIAGLPISFRHDLYSARYMWRPEIKVKETAGVAPVSLEEEMEVEGEKREAYEKPKYAMEEEPRPMAPSPAPKLLAKSAPGTTGGAYDSFAPATTAAASVSTESAKAGEFFFYSISTPVTIRRNHSALVPFIYTEIEGKKILVYNESARVGNPVSCIEVKNTSGLTLEEGPVTVYEENSYVGECMLPFMVDGDKRLLAYAVDQGVAVNKEVKSQYESVHEVIVRGSVIETYYYQINETKYTLKNKGDEEKEVIIEHPKEYGFEPWKTEKFEEETPNYYRWKVALEPRKSQEFTVKLRRLLSSLLNVIGLNTAIIEDYFNRGLITGEENSFLKRISELQSQVNEIELEMNDLQREKQGIFEYQERLRENLKVLGNTRQEAELKERYISTLSAQEDRIQEIETRLKELNKKREDIKQEMDTIIKEYAEKTGS